MERLVRLLDTSTKILAPNRVEAIAGTSKKARDGHIVEMRGMDTSAFLRSGTILWQHDPNIPVGIPVSGRVDSEGNLRLEIEFAPDDVSEDAKRTKGLVKSGIVRNLSIGFDVIDATPLDPRKPYGGMRVTRSELLEVSFVSVPADPNSVVTARAQRAGKVLSNANHQALQQAHDLAEQCRGTIADVLESAAEGGGSTEEDRDRERRMRQAEAFRLRWSPVELEELQMAEDARRAPYDYAARQRDAARVRKGRALTCLR